VIFTKFHDFYGDFVHLQPLIILLHAGASRHILLTLSMFLQYTFCDAFLQKIVNPSAVISPEYVIYWIINVHNSAAFLIR